MHNVDIDDDLKLSEREPSIRIRVSKVKHLVNVRLLNKINNIFRLDIYLNYLLHSSSSVLRKLISC